VGAVKILRNINIQDVSLAGPERPFVEFSLSDGTVQINLGFADLYETIVVDQCEFQEALEGLFYGKGCDGEQNPNR